MRFEKGSSRRRLTLSITLRRRRRCCVHVVDTWIHHVVKSSSSAMCVCVCMWVLHLGLFVFIKLYRRAHRPTTCRVSKRNTARATTDDDDELTAVTLYTTSCYSSVDTRPWKQSWKLTCRLTDIASRKSRSQFRLTSRCLYSPRPMIGPGGATICLSVCLLHHRYGPVSGLNCCQPSVVTSGLGWTVDGL